MGHGPSLIPDPFILVVQLGIFVASWVVLQRFVFRPYLELIAAREKRTVGLKDEAYHSRAKASELREAFESSMKEERHRISQFVDEERRKLADEEREILQAARMQASELLERSRKETQAEVEKARHELLPQVRDYSGQIVSKLMGYKVTLPHSVNSPTNESFNFQTIVS